MTDETALRSTTTVDWRAGAAAGAGGAIGAAARWAVGIGLDVEAASTGAFPWHTFVVNALGCLAIGVVAGRLVDPIARAFVLTGILGGFTTFSAFAVEANDLADADRAGIAAGYVVASLVVGVGAALLGRAWSDRT